MNNAHKLIAAARRVAKNESRASGIPYQKCLDLVAVRAGIPTWAAFMAAPVPVDDDSREAALEPDFSVVPSDRHLQTIVCHGMRVGATSFQAYRRDGNGQPPVLDFVLEDGNSRPIDARGLSMEALETECLDATPTVDGALMRMRMTWPGPTSSTAAVTGTFDGSMPHRFRDEEAAYDFESAISYPNPVQGMRERVRDALERRRIGRDGQQLRRLMQERGIFYEPDSGPAIAKAPDGRLIRLRHGYCMTAFSPPGAGRMAGTVVPMVLTGDTSSFVIHDDGQIHAHTSGYRATIGRVAVIRTSGGGTGAINPFGAEWLVSMDDRVLRGYLDKVSQALCPHDARVARLVMETAHAQIRVAGETTIVRIRDALVVDLDGRLAREAVASLLPLTTPAARTFTERSSIVPSDLRGTGTRDDPSPFTLYIVRDPLDGGAREPLVAAIQTAVWYKTSMRGPGSVDENQARLGPCGVATVYFDFHRSTRLPVMEKMLTYARSSWDSLVVCGNSASTMLAMYGEREGRDILDMFHCRLIPAQSSGREADLIDPRNHVGYGRMRSTPWGRAILAGGPHRSPELAMPVFFADDVLKGRAYARGCTGPAPVG